MNPVAPQHERAVAAGARCWECPLHNAHQGPVPPTLPPTGPIDLLVVAEAPGPVEVDEGRTLVGPSGREVRQALAAGGTDPGSVGYTNAMLCRPLGGDLDDFLRECKRRRLPSPLECCKPRLQAELGRAKFAIYVGGAAIKAAGVGDSVMRLRGTPVAGPPPGLVTLHPAFVLRDSGRLMRGVFRHDVAKAVRLARGGNTWREPDYTTSWSGEWLAGALKKLATEPIIAVDTETDGKDPWTCRIRRIGIGTAEHAVIYAPLSTDGNWLLDAASREYVEAMLREFFARPLPFVFHNFYGFDSVVLAQHGMPVNEESIFDSLIGHHIGATSEFPHSLEFLASIYTDAPRWKDWTKHGKSDD